MSFRLSLSSIVVFSLAACGSAPEPGATGLLSEDEAMSIARGEITEAERNVTVELTQYGADRQMAYEVVLTTETLDGVVRDVHVAVGATSGEVLATWSPRSTGEQGMHGAPEPQIHHTQEYARPGHHGSTPLLVYRGGSVLHTNQTQAIFWGSEWNNASFAGDKVSGLDSFFDGFGGSGYANTNTEYTDGSGAVTANSTYLGHAIDSSAAPSGAISVSQAVAEACKMTNNNPSSNAVYFLYTSTGAGRVSYCAWHSWGNCSNGAPVQVAYMPNIDGLAGCDPGDSRTVHSQGLEAVTNVTAHELSEAMTDPRGGGWTDSSGAENGDKCAWTFNGIVTLGNGSTWKLQQEWSNDAYNGATGSPRGCIETK